jgi:hypothetical protein
LRKGDSAIKLSHWQLKLALLNLALSEKGNRVARPSLCEATALCTHIFGVMLKAIRIQIRPAKKDRMIGILSKVFCYVVANVVVFTTKYRQYKNLKDTPPFSTTMING